MGSLSIAHLGLILVAAFLLLGRSRFSAAMGGFGEGLKSFRKGLVESSSALDAGKTAGEAEPTQPHSSDI